MKGYVEQVARRTVPGYVNILGEATNAATVSVNTILAYRKDRYFRAELAVNNTANPVWLGITNVAVLAVDASNYVSSMETGHVFVPKTPEIFTYDADGNLLSDRRWNYTWDAENRLIKVESRPDTPSSSWRRIEWTFDTLGRRIQQVTSIWTNNAWFVVENLKFVSDPMLFGRHIVELNATNNTLVRSYVWGLDLSETMAGAGGVGGLAWVTLHTASGPASGTHFTCYDGNGNIVALVSATTGDVTARYEYGPFGEPIRISGPAATLNPFRFSTKRTNSTTDLVLYEYRAYSPSTGRWPNRDPIGETGFETLRRKRSSVILGEPNRYEFIHNDPLNRIDPVGLWQWGWPPWGNKKDKKCKDCEKQDNPAMDLFKTAADTLASTLHDAEVGGKLPPAVRLLLLAADAKKGCGDMKAAADTCMNFASDPSQEDCLQCCHAIMNSFPGLGGWSYFECHAICAQF
jgi:RHS repeat-associated protein